MIRLSTGPCFIELQGEMNKRQAAKHEQVLEDAPFRKKECISQSESHKATIKVKYISYVLTTYVWTDEYVQVRFCRPHTPATDTRYVCTKYMWIKPSGLIPCLKRR